METPGQPVTPVTPSVKRGLAAAIDHTFNDFIYGHNAVTATAATVTTTVVITGTTTVVITGMTTGQMTPGKKKSAREELFNALNNGPRGGSGFETCGR